MYVNKIEQCFLQTTVKPNTYCTDWGNYLIINFYVMTLENKRRNYSREDTIQGNTVYIFIFEIGNK